MDDGGIHLHLRRGDERAPVSDVHLVCNQQPGVPVDSGARVPAAIGLVGVVRLHRNQVIAAVLQVGTEIVAKTDVPIRPLAEKLTVDPHLAELIDAVELDRHLSAAVRFGNAEMLPVPADTRGQIAALAPRRRILTEGPLDAEVMRQVHVFPTRVREIRLLRAGRIPVEEPPAEVEGIPDARPAAPTLRVRQYRRDTGRPHCLSQQTAPCREIHLVLHILAPGCVRIIHLNYYPPNCEAASKTRPVNQILNLRRSVIDAPSILYMAYYCLISRRRDS